jgi:hypothetical protein
MCFSAPASFAASLVLTGLGTESVRRAPTRAYLPFAAIPLIFAAQQATEGALWLVLSRSPYWKSTTNLGKLFLFFALLVWPSFLPFSLVFLEKDRTRRKLLVVLTLVGLALGGYLMACAAGRPSYACVAFQHVYYSVQVDPALRPIVPLVYLTTIAVPLVVSSVRGTAAFAVAAIGSFLAAGALYRTGFASVWCFFAALLSATVLLIVRADHRAKRVTSS